MIYTSPHVKRQQQTQKHVVPAASSAPDRPTRRFPHAIRQLRAVSSSGRRADTSGGRDGPTRHDCQVACHRSWRRRQTERGAATGVGRPCALVWETLPGRVSGCVEAGRSQQADHNGTLLAIKATKLVFVTTKRKAQKWTKNVISPDYVSLKSQPEFRCQFASGL